MSSLDRRINEYLEDLINIGIALSAEKNHNRLLERILREARKFTRADAGTLYLCEADCLVFKIIQNDTLGIQQGGEGEEINLPPVPLSPNNVSSWAALHKKSVNIPDVYNTQDFDLSGPKKYDAITGYHTRSMLVVPLENYEGKVIGVLQLINALDEQGNITAFAPELEKVIFSLASQAAVSLTNMQYLEEINSLLQSFVQVMATAIDARTPYNVNHTRNIARMAEKLALCIDGLESGPLAGERFNENRIAQLVMAAWLHDIGKVAIPLNVMDKPNRLGSRGEIVRQRLELAEARLKYEYLENKLAENYSEDLEKDYKERLAKLDHIRSIIEKADHPATFVDNRLAAEIRSVASWEYLPGRTLLDDIELKCLCIQKGTLTEEERRIMESHVAVAQRMLEKIRFNSKYKDVPGWALSHHEFLDGTGYPKGLKEDEISLEARILTVLDVFDALTATDRPYKKAVSPEAALGILAKMAEEGKVDPRVVDVLQQNRLWE